MKVSIVIPNYNGRDLLKKNLPLIIQSAPHTEIIVVDDASTDDSVAFLTKQFPAITVIQHKQNLRFAQACNSGVKAASGDVIVLLNSDVVPQDNFLAPLLRHFSDEKVFSVGCREIEHQGQKEVISGRTEGTFRRGFLIHWRPEDQESQETLWTFGGSMAVDRVKYLQLGGMDQIFAPAYWEDIDLCWRAKQRGWKMIFEKDAVVYHNHETTNVSVFGKHRMEVMAYRNQILFMWKNIRGVQLIKHLVWLPYHLIITSIRTQGLFLEAFGKAIQRYCSAHTQI